MQIKTTDGVMRQVSQVQLEKAYRAIEKHQAMEDVSIQELIMSMSKQSCKYKQKAQANIKRISQVQNTPVTQDDVKAALSKVVKHGSSSQIADAMYQAMQFECARFMKHLLSKFME